MTSAYSPFGPQPIAPCRGHAFQSDRATVPESFCDAILGASSDGGSTSYYELPAGATELNDLIEHKRMSFALGNIFKACYRFGEKDAASRLYDINKIIYFAERLKALETGRVQ